jgi:hypothetical protein
MVAFWQIAAGPGFNFELELEASGCAIEVN